MESSSEPMDRLQTYSIQELTIQKADPLGSAFSPYNYNINHFIIIVKNGAS